MKLNELIRKSRENLGMTQMELAEKLGYEYSMFVSIMEAGKAKIPMETLGKLILILGLPEKKILSEISKAHMQKIVVQINKGKSDLGAVK